MYFRGCLPYLKNQNQVVHPHKGMQIIFCNRPKEYAARVMSNVMSSHAREMNATPEERKRKKTIISISDGSKTNPWTPETLWWLTVSPISTRTNPHNF